MSATRDKTGKNSDYMEDRDGMDRNVSDQVMVSFCGHIIWWFLEGLLICTLSLLFCVSRYDCLEILIQESEMDFRLPNMHFKRKLPSRETSMVNCYRSFEKELCFVLWLLTLTSCTLVWL